MQDPKKYETNKSAASDVVKVFVPKLLANLEWSMEENVLDYGCGAGSTGFNAILPKVQEFNSKMYSVDVSPKMLEYAKEHYPHERINYAQGNILEEFPFEHVKFDKIFAVNVFNFVRDLRAVLTLFHNYLKPGGQLCFTIPLANNYIIQANKELALGSSWASVMKEYMNFHPEWSEYPKGQEHRELQNLIQSCGYQVTELEVMERSFHFDTMDSCLEFALSVNPCLGNISGHLYEAFKEDLRKTLTRLAGVNANVYTIDFPYTYAWGVIKKA